MDRAGFEKYLSAIPGQKEPGNGVPLPAVRRVLDAVCLRPGRGGVERSWLESSISSAEPGAARFIHYYRTAEGLGAADRRRCWDGAYQRFLSLLEELNAGGAGFDIAKAAAVRALFSGRLLNYSAVIVSAEWLPGRGGFSKATVYLPIEHPLDGFAAAGLARLAGGGADWLGKASERDMGLFGADFYPGGGIGFKVYRRYAAANAPLEDACLRLAEKLRRASNFVTVHAAYKLDGKTSKMFLDKAHFNLNKSVRLRVLEEGSGAGIKDAVALFKQRAGDSKITCVSVDPRGSYFEMYFA